MSIIFKILRFLNKKEKQRSLILFILILLTGIVDTLGIASIFPFISILSDPNLINTNPTLNFLSIKFDQLGITNYLPFTKIRELQRNSKSCLLLRSQPIFMKTR